MTRNCLWRRYFISVISVIVATISLLLKMYSVDVYVTVLAISAINMVYDCSLYMVQNKNLYNGCLHIITSDPSKDVFNMECYGTPDDWASHSELLIKVDSDIKNNGGE